MTLKVDDKITVIDIMRVQAHQVTVTYVDERGFTFEPATGFWRIDKEVESRWFGTDPLATEGIGWCHGWEGPAVDALLAANALS